MISELQPLEGKKKRIAGLSDGQGGNDHYLSHSFTAEAFTIPATSLADASQSEAQFSCSSICYHSRIMSVQFKGLKYTLGVLEKCTNARFTVAFIKFLIEILIL